MIHSTDVKINFLGSGHPGGPASSLLVDAHILLEASPTALCELKQRGKDLREIDVIFISSLHGEHTFGLPFLLFERAFVQRAARPLWVVGPRGLAEYGMRQLRFAFPDLADEIAMRSRVKWEEVGERYSRNQVVAYQPVAMAGGLGFRFVVRDMIVAYGTTEASAEDLAKLGMGAEACILSHRRSRALRCVPETGRAVAEVLRGGARRVFVMHVADAEAARAAGAELAYDRDEIRIAPAVPAAA